MYVNESCVNMKDIYIILISVLAGVIVLVGGFTIYRKSAQSNSDIQEATQIESITVKAEEEPSVEDEELVDAAEPEPVLPSTRSLLMQCSQYGYDPSKLLPILLNTFGDGTVNLDAFLAGDYNERLVFQDDFYTVTICRMYNETYAVIVESDETHVYYVTSGYVPEISYNEVKSLSKALGIADKAIIYNLGNLAVLYRDSHYTLEPTDKTLWHVYTDLGMPIGDLRVHKDCSVLVREGEENVVWRYYDFLEPDLSQFKLSELTEPEDLNAEIDSLFPGQQLHNTSKLDVDELLKAYEVAQHPIKGDYVESDQYILLRKLMLSKLPEFTHWYVDKNNGSLYLVNANKSTRECPYQIQWASYHSGKVLLLHDEE